MPMAHDLLSPEVLTIDVPTTIRVATSSVGVNWTAIVSIVAMLVTAGVSTFQIKSSRKLELDKLKLAEQRKWLAEYIDLVSACMGKLDRIDRVLAKAPQREFCEVEDHFEIADAMIQKLSYLTEIDEGQYKILNLMEHASWQMKKSIEKPYDRYDPIDVPSDETDDLMTEIIAKKKAELTRIAQ